MEKLCYVLRVPRSVPGARLRDGLIEKAVPQIRAADGLYVSVNVNDEHVNEDIRISPVEPPFRAMVSFWMECCEDRLPAEAALREHCDVLHGYLTVESRPLEPNPPPGERAPGTNIITLVARRPDLDYDRFIDIWHNDHKRVAIETQSTFGYVRNVVVRKLTPDAPDFDGVVEESFPLEALTSQHAFYNCDNDAEYQRRLEIMMNSVNRFLLMEPTESTAMSEYFLA